MYSMHDDEAALISVASENCLVLNFLKQRSSHSYLQADAGSSICELTGAVVVAPSQSLKSCETVIRVPRRHADALPGGKANRKQVLCLVLQNMA